MPHHKYLIIGGGMTADSAVRGIRSKDADGSIGLISEEGDPPYDRPPLSKGLWNGMEEERIWRGTSDLGVELHLGRRALRVDRDTHTVTDDRGVIYSYEKLLLATGLLPNRLASDVPGVIYFRTLADFRRLKAATEVGRRFAVIGGGFIGTEIASSLAQAGKEVVVLFEEEHLCSAVATPEMGVVLNQLFRDNGVELRPGVKVTTVRKSGPKLLVSVAGDAPETLRVDGVVAGIGSQPNTILAEGAGLEVNDGVVVDASFRTLDPDVFAAGDVAAFWSVPLGRTLRVEHEDHANASGQIAGQAMAGADVSYDRVPTFYSKIFDVRYEVVGDIDPEMDILEDWKERHRKGVVYYLRSGRVRGVTLWNLTRKVKAARTLIQDPSSFFPFDESAKISLD